jgi:hypothetical protein
MVSVISLGKVYTMGTVNLTLFAPQLLTGSADTKYNHLSISDKLTLTHIWRQTNVKRSRVY